MNVEVGAIKKDVSNPDNQAIEKLPIQGKDLSEKEIKLKEFQIEMKKKSKLLEIIPNGVDAKNGRTSIDFSFIQNKDQFLKFFKSLDYKEQFLHIHSLVGFRSQIYHAESEEMNYMFAVFFQGEQKIDESSLFHEAKKDLCLKRVRKWVVKAFLQSLQSERLNIATFISGQDASFDRKIKEKSEEDSKMKEIKSLVEKLVGEKQKLVENIQLLEESLNMTKAALKIKENEFEKNNEEIKKLKESKEVLMKRNQ